MWTAHVGIPTDRHLESKEGSDIKTTTYTNDAMDCLRSLTLVLSVLVIWDCFVQAKPLLV